MEEERFVDVVIDAPASQLDRPFTYRLPSHLAGRVQMGSLVLVPLQNRMQVGYVLGYRDRPDLPAIRDVEAVVEEPPVFDETMLELCAWMSERYLCTLSQALRLAIPPGRVRRVAELVTLTRDPWEALNVIPEKCGRKRDVVRALQEAGGELPLPDLRKTMGGRLSSSLLKELREEGIIVHRYVIPSPRASRVRMRVAELTPKGLEALREGTGSRITPARRRVLETLLEHGRRMNAIALQEKSGGSPAMLRGCAEAGWIRFEHEERLRDPFAHRSFPPTERHELDPHQKEALDRIVAALERGGGVFLLQGVTGSGKTEVYLHAIEYAMRQGKTALVLVPEISLTPQMVQRFKGRLGEEVAVLHSALGLGERYDQWRGIREGRYRVVIGARSALFAPLRELGLIIIDEEHETTYKESSPPRYHAREVAEKRARLSGAVLVLGSATPSLESHHACQVGDYEPLVLPSRVDGRALPGMEVVDMRELSTRGERTILSPRLLNALAHLHKSGEQAILFLNRRGFASFLQCPRCGHIFRCRNCSVSLCYHARGPYLQCHHCNWVEHPPFICPQCGNSVHRYAGVGTERVEEELRRLLPVLKCLRMDADTTVRKDAHWEILESFRRGEAQVLLGTQMIAKGLDIPSVTLVGVINADTSLAFPDFRAGERTYQLLTQVSGRAGRGRLPGRVIVQTYCPEHYAIDAAVRGDPEGFYRRELGFRREALYPPFCRLVNLVVSGIVEEHAREAAEFLGEELRARIPGGNGILLGPAPAPISRLKGRYRFHLLVKVLGPRGLEEELRASMDYFERFRSFFCRKRTIRKEDISLAVDVDPVTLV
ncbi:MAG: primosomal protein N' [Actinomycetota bacterium]